MVCITRFTPRESLTLKGQTIKIDCFALQIELREREREKNTNDKMTTKTEMHIELSVCFSTRIQFVRMEKGELDVGEKCYLSKT